MSPTVPLRDLADDQLDHLARHGASPTTLYRTLGNHPRLLPAWVDFAWTLRGAVSLPRDLREIMILRAVQLAGSDYAWSEHEVMAREAGVGEDRIAALREWQESSLFEPDERLCLELVEHAVTRTVDEELLGRLSARFDDEELIELAMTIGFYVMVPVVLHVLRVPVLAADR